MQTERGVALALTAMLDERLKEAIQGRLIDDNELKEQMFAITHLG
jgi:hypothetical protein